MTNTIANRIYLIGMMASGKSTIGKLLAERLEYDFIEMDNVIEKEFGSSISEIFAKHGEHYFRELESKLLVKLSSQHHIVVSTGGGTPLYHNGIDQMKKSGEVIWLKVSKKEIFNRLSNSTHRPLAREITRNSLTKLVTKRRPIYKKASIKVWNKGKLEDVVNRICDKLRINTQV